MSHLTSLLSQSSSSRIIQFICTYLNPIVQSLLESLTARIVRIVPFSFNYFPQEINEQIRKPNPQDQLFKQNTDTYSINRFFIYDQQVFFQKDKEMRVRWSPSQPLPQVHHAYLRLGWVSSTQSSTTSNLSSTQHYKGPSRTKVNFLLHSRPSGNQWKSLFQPYLISMGML